MWAQLQRGHETRGCQPTVTWEHSRGHSHPGQRAIHLAEPWRWDDYWNFSRWIQMNNYNMHSFFSAVLRRKCWHSIWMAAENKFAANYAKGKVHLCLSIVCLPPVLYVLLLSIIYFCCPTIYIFIPCTVGVEHPHFNCTCAMTTKAYSILLFWK